MSKEIRFSNFILNPSSGRLTEFISEVDKRELSLSPQPTRLLEILLESHPDMVSHQEIKKIIWSEVQVDFEKSMHFCVRQIRVALRDNASEPKYIQTIARRGYRWIGGAPSYVNTTSKKKIISFR